MIDIEIKKCGICIGCELEQEQAALIKRMDDEIFMPMLRRLAERYDPPNSQVRPDPRSHESRSIMRERSALLDYRSRSIRATITQYGYPTCIRPVIFVPKAAA